MSFEIKDGRTRILQDQVERCEDINNLLEFLAQNDRSMIEWRAFINHLVDMSGFSYTQFAKNCGMSRKTIVSWCEKGVMPRSRNQFIRIGFAVGMSLDMMNDFLQRYGKHPRLYSKSIEDALFIFALNNDLSYESAALLQERFGELFHSDEKKNLSKNVYKTINLQSRILSLQTIQQLETFLQENREAFSAPYRTLVEFIDNYVEVNTHDYVETNKAASLHAFLCEKVKNPKMVSTYNTMISMLRNSAVIPRRNALIVLGIHFDMALDDINAMLSMAGMEPLCAKDKLESVLIYAIENAVLNNPDIELSNAMLLKNFTENPEVKRHCLQIIDRYESGGYASLEEDGGVIRYVEDALRYLDPESTGEIFSLLGISA